MAKSRFTQVEIEDIIKSYTVNLESIMSLKKRYSAHSYTIQKVLKDHDVEIRFGCEYAAHRKQTLATLTPDVIQKLCFKYENELKSLEQLSKELGLAPRTIRNRLVAAGVEIRDSNTQSSIANKEMRASNRTHQCNHDYFKTWSSNMAYILGLIFADGSLCKNRIKLALKSDDVYLLEMIKTEMGYTGEIHFESPLVKNKRYSAAKLDISSMDIREDLIGLGIHERKSLTIEFPNVPKEYELDFIRGYFDGDGFTKKGQYLRCGFSCGSLSFITETAMKLEAYGMSKRNISKHKSANCFTFEYSSKELPQFYKLMYGNNPKFYLKRKREVFDAYFSGNE